MPPTLVRNLSRTNLRRGRTPNLDALEAPSSTADALVDDLSDTLRDKSTNGVKSQLKMMQVDRIREVTGGPHESVGEDDSAGEQLKKERRALVDDLWGKLYFQIKNAGGRSKPVSGGELRDMGSRARSGARGIAVLGSGELVEGMQGIGDLLYEMGGVQPVESPRVASRLKRIHKRVKSATRSTENFGALGKALSGGTRKAMRKDVRKLVNQREEVKDAARDIMREHDASGRANHYDGLAAHGSREVGFSSPGIAAELKGLIENHLMSGLYEQFEGFTTNLGEVDATDAEGSIDEFRILSRGVEEHDQAKGRG